MSKMLFFILVLVFGISSIYSSEILTCSYQKTNTCTDNERLFFASSNLSANIKLDNIFPIYDYSVCCSSNETLVNFSTINLELNQSCLENNPLLYFTGNSNGRVAKDYNPIHHKYGLCYEVPDKSYALSIDFVPKDAIINEFQCLFRVSDRVNGRVSSCDASYNTNDFYEYSVVGQLFAGIDVLSCNNDCTNKLTGRIDYACSLKMPQKCSNVPVMCDSSLVNSWVSYNTTHEILCNNPWVKFRKKAFTNENLIIETSTKNVCKNLIKTPYSVFFNDEIITMSVFVCED